MAIKDCSLLLFRLQYFDQLHKLHFCEVHPVSEASLILQWKDRDLLAVL